jgi:hypothetical protein
LASSRGVAARDRAIDQLRNSPRLVVQWTGIDGGTLAPAFPLLQLNDPEKWMHTTAVPLPVLVVTELGADLGDVFGDPLLSVMVNPTDSLAVLCPAKAVDGLSAASNMTNRSTLRLPDAIRCPYLERSCPRTGQLTDGHRNSAEQQQELGQRV